MPTKRKNPTQLRGAVNNIILESLYSGEKYGYEIIKEVEEKTNGKIKLKQPSLYSSLKRFESKNYIKSYWTDSEIGGKRHYYSLTDEGLKYYKKNILKESDEDEVNENEVNENDYTEIETPDNDDYLEDKISGESYDEDNEDETYDIDTPETTSDYSKYRFDVHDRMKELLDDNDDIADDKEELLDELYENKDSSEIYTEDDLIKDQTEIEERSSVPVDHEFRTPTPLTDEIIKSEEAKDEVVEDSKPVQEPTPIDTKANTETKYYNIESTHNAYDDITNIEESVSDNALDDLIHHDPDEKQDSYEKVKEENILAEQKPKIYTDEFGITKMYYPEEEKKPVNNKVFDNVVYHSNVNTIFDKSAQKKNEAPKNTLQLDELSDAEREQRTTSFMKKFENRTRELAANKESTHEPEPETQPENNVDYKKVLTGLYDANNEYQPEEQYVSDEECEIPNSENYDDEENYYEEDETKEPEQDYNVKIYTEEKSKKTESNYLLVNKAKFIFGLTMLVFMLLQVTIMLIVFKNKDLLMKKQYWIFQVSYVVIALTTLYFCIPVFISPNKQTSNTFKLGYMLMFGVLTFLIIVILTYALNTFLGMEISNIEYYIPTLAVPMILALNFIFGPIIYKIISQNKKLY